MVKESGGRPKRRPPESEGRPKRVCKPPLRFNEGGGDSGHHQHTKPYAPKVQSPVKERVACSWASRAVGGCLDTFVDTRNMFQHVSSKHQGRRPFSCPHCTDTFGRAGSLRTHVCTVHEKRKDHVCPHCAAAFGRAGDLTRHVRRVHEKRKGH